MNFNERSFLNCIICIVIIHTELYLMTLAFWKDLFNMTPLNFVNLGNAARHEELHNLDFLTFSMRLHHVIA